MMKTVFRLTVPKNISIPDFLAISISLVAAYLGLFSGHKSFSKELVLFLLFLNSLDLTFVLLSGNSINHYKEKISHFLHSPKFIGVDIVPALFISEFVYVSYLQGFFLELMAFILTWFIIRIARLTLIDFLIP